MTFFFSFVSTQFNSKCFGVVCEKMAVINYIKYSCALCQQV